jgi:hypothetical protein
MLMCFKSSYTYLHAQIYTHMHFNSCTHRLCHVFNSWCKKIPCRIFGSLWCVSLQNFVCQVAVSLVIKQKVKCCIFIYFILGLFNFSFSGRDSVALNDRIISDLWTGKGLGRKCHDQIWATILVLAYRDWEEPSQGFSLLLQNIQ